MKDKQKLIIFDERNIWVFLFNLRHVIHIPSFRIVNLLCCGDHFRSIAFIDANTNYRNPYLLDVSQPYLSNHRRTSLGRPRDVSEGRPEDVSKTLPLDLQIIPYKDVLVTSAGDFLRGSAGDFPWCYIQDIMGSSSGRCIGKSLGRHISM